MSKPLRILVLLFVFSFPVLAIVKGVTGHSSDKTPAIMAAVISSLATIMIGFLNDWPKSLAHRLRGSSHKTVKHPRIRPAQSTLSSTTNPQGSTPIAYIRNLAGAAPRQFPRELKQYLDVSRPRWLWHNFSDELHGTIRHQESIRREGKIVWAAIVQANDFLFKDDPIDCPASIIFSEDPWFDDRPEELDSMARSLFKLKGTRPRYPDALRFAKMLTNERERAMRLKAPLALTEGKAVFHSSIILPRKHLPHGVISGRFMPIFVDPRGTGEVLLVPPAFWPPVLLTQWKRGI